MLNDVNINTESLIQINHNIQKYSNNPKKVKLIAVTKTFSHKSINSAIENNVYDIGENKIQDKENRETYNPLYRENPKQQNKKNSI